jgi:hypothetical protein
MKNGGNSRDVESEEISLAASSSNNSSLSSNNCNQSNEEQIRRRQRRHWRTPMIITIAGLTIAVLVLAVYSVILSIKYFALEDKYKVAMTVASKVKCMSRVLKNEFNVTATVCDGITVQNSYMTNACVVNCLSLSCNFS